MQVQHLLSLFRLSVCRTYHVHCQKWLNLLIEHFSIMQYAQHSTFLTPDILAKKISSIRIVSQ